MRSASLVFFVGEELEQNGSGDNAQFQLILITFLSASRGQIGPKPYYFEIGLHWGLGPATRRLNGAIWGFQTAHHLAGLNSEILFSGVRRPRAAISALSLPRSLARGGGSACFGRVLGAKQRQLPLVTSKYDARVRSASLISPVRWGYYDVVPRAIARGDKKHPTREKNAAPERRATNNKKRHMPSHPPPRHHSPGRERC